MRGRSLDRLVVSTALALVLSAATALPATADMVEPDQWIESAVPLPEAANLPPPSAVDVRDTATDTVGGVPTNGGAAPTDSPSVVATTPEGDGVPVPDAANIAPPSLKDVVKAPFAALPAGDIPVAMKLSDILTSKPDRTSDRKQRAVLESFYKERNFAPLWLSDGKANARATAAIARLKASNADGLDPDEYAIPDFKSLTTPQALAEAELRFSNTVLLYARHAQAGRVAPSRISANIEFALPIPDTADVLAKVSAAKDVTKALDDFNPHHPGFRALKAKLAEIRARPPEALPVRIPGGATVKVGKKDPRVPLVRERLGEKGDPTDTTYDRSLAAAVKKFQQRKDLSPTGNLNSATIEALNGPRRTNQVETILANMERWRWLPRELGKTHVVVNIPDFNLRLVREGATLFNTRIVVGKPVTPTPLLSATMKYITVNPTWNVPPSIVYNEYLPALQQDPTVLSRLGLQVSYNRDGSIHISQPPGERNALGRLRFNFPNRFLVYQHDTPDKHLFAHDKRAFSHGCMRVQDPLRYAEVLLSLVLPKEGYTQDRLRKMFGSEERDIPFPTHIPVYIVYMNAFVDDGGQLVVRDDLYGIDGRVQAALKGDYRIAESAIMEEKGREATSVRRVTSARRERIDPRPAQGLGFFGLFFQ